MLTDTYKAVSSQFSFARVHSYFVKRANLPINYQPISDFSPIWNNRRRRRSRNLNSRGTYVSLPSRQQAVVGGVGVVVIESSILLYI